MATNTNLNTSKGLESIAKEEHDSVEYRRRVSMYSDGTTVSYEDTSFISGDSPAVLDVESNLGRVGHGGYLANDGPGNILVEFSFDGSTYGGQHTVKSQEILDFENASFKKIRLTHVANTAYRCLVL